MGLKPKIVFTSHTRIVAEEFDYLCRNFQASVVLIYLRLVHLDGKQNKNCVVAASYKDIAEGLPLKRLAVIEAIKKLEEKKLIEVIRTNKKINIYRLIEFPGIDYSADYPKEGKNKNEQSGKQTRQSTSGNKKDSVNEMEQDPFAETPDTSNYNR